MNGHLPEPRPHLDVVLRSFRPHRSGYAARTYTVETVDTAGRRRCVGVVFRDVDAWGRPGSWLVRGTDGQVLVSPAEQTVRFSFRPRTGSAREDAQRATRR